MIVKEIIERDFAKAAKDGYLVVPARVLYAPNYGVPQSRERVFFIGFRKNALTKEALHELSKDIISDQFDPYPIKTHGDNLLPIVTCKDAFVGLSEPEDNTDLSQQNIQKQNIWVLIAKDKQR